MDTDTLRVTVVGSYNHGLTMSVPHHPVSGETVLGNSFTESVGGKGSNQAVGAARLGADTTFVGHIGNDRFAEAAIDLWEQEGVDACVTQDDNTHTGVGFVVVDELGENIISVAPGANTYLDGNDVRENADAIVNSDVVLCQLEVENEPVATAFDIAADDTTTILNPAPARNLPEELLASVDVLTPNREEARTLAKVDQEVPPDAIAKDLLARGPNAVVLTLGSDGALVATSSDIVDIDVVDKDVVDTTGAGDAFNAGLAVALGKGHNLVDAAKFACHAGAAACTEYEVVPALPEHGDLPTI